MRINMTEIENIENMRSVPAGDYICRVAEVQESISPASHERWSLRLEVTEGEWEGRTACWDTLHWSERGAPRAKFILQAMGVPLPDGEQEYVPDMIEGRRVLVEVRPEEREDPITGVRRLINRVPFTGYARVEGEQ